MATTAYDEATAALVESADDTARFGVVISALMPDVVALLSRCSTDGARTLLPRVWDEAYSTRAAFDPDVQTAKAWVLAIARRHAMQHPLNCMACVEGLRPADMPFAEWAEFAAARDEADVAGDLHALMRETSFAARDLVILMSSLGVTDDEAAAIVGLDPATAPRELFRIRTRMLAVLAGLDSPPPSRGVPAESVSVAPLT